MPVDEIFDVIVVGAGNAAFCAALSASEQGARVLVIERAPKKDRGGNSAFTGGGFRIVHNGVEDIRRIIPDLTEEQVENTDFGVYSAEQYLDDFGRITQYYCDPDLAETIVRNSTSTVEWIRDKGIRFEAEYGRQAFKHKGKFKFTAVVVRAAGGGRGLIEGQVKAAEKAGIQVRYGSQVVSLVRGASGVAGVRAVVDGVEQEIRGRAVVLASGGFEANREWRARYLGPGWDLAKVRGSRYNTGDGIRMAVDIGAQPYGQWSGCHACSWERYAPDFGELDALTSGERHCYQFSVMVNSEGKRFIDEGADFRNLTFGKQGRVILQQPGAFAWQVFDAQGAQFQHSEYKMRGATKVVADTLEELVAKMKDVDPVQFVKTIKEYNASINRDVPFNPNVKDGRSTVGLPIPKSNWATPIETPPFEAYSVGTALTFTYGGLKINPSAHVLDVADAPIPGLYAAGELVGGIFYFNYPGATGLMSGAVFGRIAGREAGAFSLAARAGSRGAAAA
jgi:tricarballylate dehydrogenase